MNFIVFVEKKIQDVVFQEATSALEARRMVESRHDVVRTFAVEEI